MSWIHFLFVFLRKSAQEERGGQDIELDPFSYCFIKKINTGGERRTEMSWIHFLIVFLRKSIHEAGEGERGGQKMSWIHFRIVLLRKSMQEERGGSK